MQEHNDSDMPIHRSVLLREVLELLSPVDGGVYFDGTFGGGGYSRALLESANCSIIACDRDDRVVAIADDFGKKYLGRFTFFHEKFSSIKSLLQDPVDGIVLDLGVSNFQLSDPTRGFSFRAAGPIDMSMGLCDETAMDVLRKYSENDLANIIYKFGEEHFSRRIAKNIKLNLKNIHNTEDLANIIRKCVGKKGKIDAATKTFQALRIFVNRELEELEKILADSIDVLKPSGKILVVSFHSLEDRIVKLFFREMCATGRFALLTKKPIIASEEELSSNSKSRSAKLRGIYML
ncbi:MAG: 16S rRNA (cytosine(1402)-N(4))-methyltransferase RsmH [Holosporaceae bacterium]|jgi:16S rRNA (cytosine1402-N4)-methyltransferase|nr:16S rRNA (cytosine(1402)-N(4))-methyltransferase RsmH [Holosporaceae bacterium]